MSTLGKPPCGWPLMQQWR